MQVHRLETYHFILCPKAEATFITAQKVEENLQEQFYCIIEKAHVNKCIYAPCIAQGFLVYT